MSYILEALKRAERERRAGQASLLDDVARPAPAPATANWRRWLPVALASAAVAALFTWWLLSHDGHRVPVSAPKLEAPPPVASPPAAPPPSVTATPAPAPPPAPAATIEEGRRIASLDDLQDKAPPPALKRSANEAPPEHSPQAEADVPPAPAASPNPEPEQSSTSQAAAPVENTAPAPNAAAAPAAADSRQLREMPEAYRAGFPQLSIEVHAYSDDPAQRFVLISGKRFRENDSLPEGPRIVAIVPEGIVFDWHGERVLYAINH